MVVAQEVKPSWRKLGNRRHGPKEDLGTLISKSSTQTPVSLLPSHHEVNSHPQHTGALPQQGPNAVRSSDNGQRSLETSAKGNRSSITWPQTFVTGTENWQSETTKQCLHDNVKWEEKITVHEFPARGNVFHCSHPAASSVGRVLFHFIFFQATQKKADLSVWFAATLVWVIWP